MYNMCIPNTPMLRKLGLPHEEATVSILFACRPHGPFDSPSVNHVTNKDPLLDFPVTDTRPPRPGNTQCCPICYDNKPNVYADSRLYNTMQSLVFEAARCRVEHAINWSPPTNMSMLMFNLCLKQRLTSVLLHLFDCYRDCFFLA